MDYGDSGWMRSCTAPGISKFSRADAEQSDCVCNELADDYSNLCPAQSTGGSHVGNVHVSTSVTEEG